jgi:type IV fimbrial biogenesis protein FimT
METRGSPGISNVLRRFARSLPGRSLAGGFTLIESLVVLAVGAVLVVGVTPSMKAVADSITLSSVSNSFVANLYLARSEAIKRNGRVVLCKSMNGSACAATGGWEQGWVIFHDANNNGALDAGEAVVLRQQGLAANLRVTGNQNVARYVSFTPYGQTKLIGGGFQAGTLTLCRQSTAPNEARQIILNSLGRPRVQKIALNDCF